MPAKAQMSSYHHDADYDDDASVRTPTRSELNTFQVLANLDFTNLKKPEPTSRAFFTTTSRLDSVREDASVLTREMEEPPSPPPRSVVRPDSPTTQNDAFERLTYTREYEDVRRDNASTPRDHTPRSAAQVPLPASREPSPERHYKEEESSNDAKAREEAEVDVGLEKEALLYELELMDRQGQLKLHRKLDMSNSLEEIQYQYDRAQMIVSTQQTVDWAKTSIKMGSGVLEAVLKRFGISIVDGFSNNLCKDMNKFNKPLTKMYRKYWRRGTSSPEMELAMIVFGALAMTVMANKGLMGGAPKEPLARPVPPAIPSFVATAPEQPSALRPPTMTAFGPAAPSVAPTKPATALPEWARAAMAGPLGPAQPVHFAQQQQPQQQHQPVFPELARAPNVPMMPVSYSAPQKEPLEKPVKQPKPMEFVTGPPAPAEASPSIKKFTLASPRNTRRRNNKAVDELNLDDASVA